MTPEARLALADRIEADDKVGRYTLIKTEHKTIVAALRDLPVRAQEPVAWRWRIKDANGGVSSWEISSTDPKISKMVLHDCEPLYAAPPPSGERLTSSDAGERATTIQSSDGAACGNSSQASQRDNRDLQPSPSEASKVRELTACERAMDGLEAQADIWADEINLVLIIKNIGQASRGLTDRMPPDVREGFINRQEANIDALVRQAYLEGFDRGGQSRKEYDAARVKGANEGTASELPPVADGVREAPSPTRSYYQSHSCDGFAAKVTIEWWMPVDGDLLPAWSKETAERIADSILSFAGRRMRNMVQAMRGFTVTEPDAALTPPSSGGETR